MVLYVSGRYIGMHDVVFLGNFAKPVVMRVEQRCDSTLFSKPRIRLLSKELTTSGAWSLLVLCETMLHLLSWKLNNSGSIVSISSMENRAQPPVVMRVEQQLWHGIWKFCEKTMHRLLLGELNNSMSMVSINIFKIMLRLLF